MFKAIYIENSFEAGFALGSLTAFFAGQGCGRVTAIAHPEYVEVEIFANSAPIMSYALDKLAQFV